MILEREWSTEERHDPVAHHLVDHALVPMDRLHHDLEDRIEQRARLLRFPFGEELHRALQVREEHGHLLALAFERRPRREDVLGEMLRRVGLGRREARRLLLRRFLRRTRRQKAGAGRQTAVPHELHACASRTPQL
jgi:peptidoglycan/xylan/chitin deacetylase (PgdA/CDA1 family)